MGERDFNDIQASVLRSIADEEIWRNPIFYKGEFREEEWFSLLNSGELISKNTLRKQEGNDTYCRITNQIDRLGWATIGQIENGRWAITPEGLEMVRKEIEQDEWVPYTLVTNKETAYEYFKRKSDEQDKLIDKIAAEHREPRKPKNQPEWWIDLTEGNICIVFNAPWEYATFRLEFSDILLLPKTMDIYGKHPEIEKNKWPVVIKVCEYSGVLVEWSIAQSDYRKSRTISGLDWFEYDELEDYECAKSYNKNVWFVARMRRGKDK